VAAGLILAMITGSASRAGAAGRAATRASGQIVVALGTATGGEGSAGLVLIDPSGRRLATLTTRRAGREDAEPDWSPDGKRLVFTRTSDGRRSYHIFVMNADGTSVRQLTHGIIDVSSAWSPDGRWIVYRSNYRLRMIHPDGSGGRELPTPAGPTDVEYPSWAPGGRIAYSNWSSIPQDWPATCKRAGSGCGYVISVSMNGSDRRLVVHGRDARWSPDGKTIVYTGPDGGVYTAPGSGGNGRMLARGYLADWSPDGTQIVYTRMGDTPAQDSVWIMNRDGSNPHRITTGAANPAWRS
jgi:Tol biopolymer transport system component